MANARIESWPGGPESRAYTADGDVNRPRGWEPPAPEHREEIARLIRERTEGRDAADDARSGQHMARVPARVAAVTRANKAAARTRTLRGSR